MLERMGRKGDCWDQAVAERFFATLRAEPVEREQDSTRGAAEESLGDDVERICGAERLHSHLDCVRPAEFEGKTRAAACAASSDRPRRSGPAIG
jgi:putative transposase